ncbi:MAG: YCF48-related protein [Porticoccaceae bacterium]
MKRKLQAQGESARRKITEQSNNRVVRLVVVPTPWPCMRSLHAGPYFRRWEQIMKFKHCRTWFAAWFPRAGAVVRTGAAAKVLRWPRRGQLVLLLASIFAAGGVGAGGSLQIPAIRSALASKALLTDSARLSDRIVAVGAYGDIVYSKDGKTWTQANVPSQVLLTTVFFVDDREGWAAGHDTLILHTTDAGENWTIQYEDPIPGGDLPKPILDIYFADKLHGWAIGAFSLMLVTEDGGAHWKTVSTARLRAQLEAADKETEPNFNALRPLGDGFLIVGELGTLLYYDPKLGAVDDDQKAAVADDDAEADGDALDAGDSASTADAAATSPAKSAWRIIKSPYEGSFFGVKQLSSGELLVYGLRGHIFRSLDLGNTWTSIDTGGVTTNINDAIEMDGGDVIIVGSGGTLFRLKAGSAAAERIPYPGFNGFMSVQKLDANSLLLFGDAGAQIFQL